MNKYLVIILKKMCEYVGADFDKVDVKKENWFQDYSWTKKQEKGFMNWMIDYLYNNNKVRKELYVFLPKNKKTIKGAVAMFNLCYGWKIKEG